MNMIARERFADYGAVFVFLASFGIYLWTLTPTVGLHDSGDMITSSYVSGHSPSTRLSTLYVNWQDLDDGYSNWQCCLQDEYAVSLFCLIGGDDGVSHHFKIIN